MNLITEIHPQMVGKTLFTVMAITLFIATGGVDGLQQGDRISTLAEDS